MSKDYRETTLMSAEEILEDSFFCDGHADTFRNLTLAGGDFGLEENGCHLSLPRMVEARQNLQIMAVYTKYEERGPESTVTALRIIENARGQMERLSESCGLVLTRGDLERCRQTVKPYVLLSLEGADPLVGSLEVLQAFFRMGVRAMGFTHNHNSVAAGGCAPPDQERVGLTAYGRELVGAMNKLGMLIDTAHLGRQAFDELMSLSEGPIVNSHSCSRKYVDVERNLDDQQLLDLAASGGLSAVTYVPKFLTSEARAVTSQDVFRHIEHMVEVAGIDHVAIGSDFDGVEQLPTDLGDPRGTPALVECMIGAGWSPTEIAKILGLNWYRVLAKVLPI